MLFFLLCALALAEEADWNAVLARHVDESGRVDYAATRQSAELARYIAWLAGAPEPSSRAGRMAFWINAYNALTVDLVSRNPEIRSIRELDFGLVWKVRRFKVAGRSVSLDQIEHGTLRPMGEARVHAALNCASLGCPPLYREAFRAERLEAQLQAATLRWVRSNAIHVDRSAGRVELSQIFRWFDEDFSVAHPVDIPGLSGEEERAILWLAPYLSADQQSWLKVGGYSVVWAEYDWALNAQRPTPR
jgi:hypothetical protein